VTDAHRHARLVAVNVVHAVRHGLAQFRIGKVVRLHLARFALGPIRWPRILQVSQHFLLLGIDRQRRLAPTLAGQDALRDPAKLAVPIRVLTAFPRLAIAL